MVCGISGFCIANGLELALMCDLRVVEDDAVLGFFNRRFGIPLMGRFACRNQKPFHSMAKVLFLFYYQMEEQSVFPL